MDDNEIRESWIWSTSKGRYAIKFFGTTRVYDLNTAMAMAMAIARIGILEYCGNYGMAF